MDELRFWLKCRVVIRAKALKRRHNLWDGKLKKFYMCKYGPHFAILRCVDIMFWFFIEGLTSM
jgi:hypothetical protein